MRLAILMLCLFGSGLAHAQRYDSLKIMHYNILYYGEYTSFCTTSNNHVSDKDGYLKTIIGHSLPDIFTVNELGSTAVYADRILSNTLNVDGRDYYERADNSGSSSSNLVNMLYYNTEKLALRGQSAISKSIGGQNLIRVIDHYELYVNDPELANHQDTNFIHVFVAHLAASDAGMRFLQTEATMDYIAANDLRGNVILVGDLNIKNSGVSEFQELVDYSNPDFNFVDPADALGNWYSSSSFKSVHTQSTHTSSNCYAGGGMDDRFDFALMNKSLESGTLGAKYIPDSYFTLGQDGQRLNQSLISPLNSSAPADVIQALYDMSDHLPVGFEFEVEIPEPEFTDEESEIKFKFNNPVFDHLGLDLRWSKAGNVQLKLLDLEGKILVDKKLELEAGESIHLIDVSGLSKGSYLMEISRKGAVLQREMVVKL
jgi:hypothetical protein